MDTDVTLDTICDTYEDGCAVERLDAQDLAILIISRTVRVTDGRAYATEHGYTMNMVYVREHHARRAVRC